VRPGGPSEKVVQNRVLTCCRRLVDFREKTRLNHGYKAPKNLEISLFDLFWPSLKLISRAAEKNHARVRHINRCTPLTPPVGIVDLDQNHARVQHINTYRQNPMLTTFRLLLRKFLIELSIST